MKVVGINGSARPDGNTSVIMRTVLLELEAQGIDIELIHPQSIAPCRGCYACKGLRSCVFADDDFCDCFSRIADADGILLGSPVYSADVSALMKAFLERAGVVCAMNPGLLKHKTGASVAAVRRAGGLTAVDTMNHFLLNKGVFLVGSTYWNMVYGKDPGDVLKDCEGMQNMHDLGRSMAWLMNKLNK